MRLIDGKIMIDAYELIERLEQIDLYKEDMIGKLGVVKAILVAEEMANDTEQECCNTCKRQAKLEQLDYSTVGCKHTMMDGFACMAFVDEGVVNWMVGNNGEGQCEEYISREAKRP